MDQSTPRIHFVCMSIHFNSFQFISIHFNSFQFISIHFNSFQFISIHFNSFQFISIHLCKWIMMYICLLDVLLLYGVFFLYVSIWLGKKHQQQQFAGVMLLQPPAEWCILPSKDSLRTTHTLFEVSISS